MEDWQERDLQADRIQQMYEEVEDELIALLVAALASQDDATVAYAVARGKVLLASAQLATDEWNGEAIPELYGKQVSISKPSIEAVTTASEGMFADMTATVGRRLDDLAANFRVQQARWEALAAFTAKRTGTRIGVRGISADMQAHLRENGITGFTDAAGRKWKLSTYADMAARTTTMNAQLAGVKDRVVARGDDLVNIIGPLDYPDGCPPSVLGGPYSITGATTEYNGRPIMTLDEATSYYGVFHPRCRHSLAYAG